MLCNIEYIDRWKKKTRKSKRRRNFLHRNDLCYVMMRLKFELCWVWINIVCMYTFIIFFSIDSRMTKRYLRGDKNRCSNMIIIEEIRKWYCKRWEWWDSSNCLLKDWGNETKMNDFQMNEYEILFRRWKKKIGKRKSKEDKSKHLWYTTKCGKWKK